MAWGIHIHNNDPVLCRYISSQLRGDTYGIYSYMCYDVKCKCEFWQSYTHIVVHYHKPAWAMLEIRVCSSTRDFTKAYKWTDIFHKRVLKRGKPSRSSKVSYILWQIVVKLQIFNSAHQHSQRETWHTKTKQKTVHSFVAYYWLIYVFTTCSLTVHSDSNPKVRNFTLFTHRYAKILFIYTEGNVGVTINKLSNT
jgi:hypothetical protein